MGTTNTAIYHWKLGDMALARVSRRVYAKVQVVKNEDGLFHDNKGISASENGITVTTQLCYYVETVRNKWQMWLPYTCLQLAERSRPFYGPNDCAVTQTVIDEKTAPKKRKIKDEPVFPLTVKPSTSKDPDHSLSEEIRQSTEQKEESVHQERYTNAFNEFVRLGKDLLFDDFYDALCVEKERNEDTFDYLENVDASTEDKFEMVIKNMLTDNEVDNYLCQCWRYNLLHNPHLITTFEANTNNTEDTKIIEDTHNTDDTNNTEETYNPEDIYDTEDTYNTDDTDNTGDNNSSASDTEDSSESPMDSESTTLAMIRLPSEDPSVTVHASWCLVCGLADQLWECARCPASFHLACRREWLVNIIHRKSPLGEDNKLTVASMILSSSGIMASREDRDGNLSICPSCMWGPRVGYGDVVWHKLGSCSWWPAKVFAPGDVPHCLLMREHSTNQLPLRYYGTLNHSWGDLSHICLFMPKHTAVLRAEEDLLRQAMLDACDDYIAVYLN